MDHGLASCFHVSHLPKWYAFKLTNLVQPFRPWCMINVLFFTGLTVEVSDVTVLYGQSALLTCTGTDGSSIVWKTGGTVISNGADYTISSNNDVSTLTIKSLKTDVDFTCEENTESDSATARVAGRSLFIP